MTITLPEPGQLAGEGIEMFHFSDGSYLSHAELAALASPAETVEPGTAESQLGGHGVLMGGYGDDTIVASPPPIDDSEAAPPEQAPPALVGGNVLVGGPGSDRLLGSGADEILIGGKLIRDWSLDYERLVGGYWDEGNSYAAGGGSDTLWTTAGADRIQFDLGDGQDRVVDQLHDWPALYHDPSEVVVAAATETTPPVTALRWLVDGREPDLQALRAVTDTLVFGDGIESSDIRLLRQQYDLLFQHQNGQDSLRFDNWFLADLNQLDHVLFADGTSWDGSMLEALVTFDSNASPGGVLEEPVPTGGELLFTPPEAVPG